MQIDIHLYLFITVYVTYLSIPVHGICFADYGRNVDDNVMCRNTHPVGNKGLNAARLYYFTVADQPIDPTDKCFSQY